jgi:hypothetical protein
MAFCITRGQQVAHSRIVEKLSRIEVKTTQTPMGIIKGRDQLGRFYRKSQQELRQEVFQELLEEGNNNPYIKVNIR